MKEKIKIGFIGLGARGYGMINKCFSEMRDVEVAQICDISEESLTKTKNLIEEKTGKKPGLTKDYHEILKNPDIDAVVIMTGWGQHSSMAVDSLLAGKYTAIEVGGAYDISECYDLINAYEKTGAPLMMLENCCYGRKEMMVLNMVKQGLFGEIVHCAGGYMHYLPRGELLDRKDANKNHYRLDEYLYRNCENYPTHELGPIAKILGINRGNRMLTLTSVASKSSALKIYINENHPDSKYAGKEFAQGDIVVTNIKCAGGELITLTLDTTLPRPYYSRNFTVRGTKGAYLEERRVVYLEGMEEEIKFNEEEFYEKYDHPLHKEYLELGERGGHGGMDWLVLRAFVESVKRGTQTPIDTYDTVSWMAITPLSEQSIAMGGAPVPVPDFTKGKWFRREPVTESKYCLDKICIDRETKIY